MERAPSNLQAVYQEYPWLNYHPETITTYLPPDYYNRLLKKYTFGGKSDLGYLQNYLDRRFQPQKEDILEMGFGSGRATDLLFENGIGFHSLDLVDLSTDMVARGRERYGGTTGVSIVEADILEYLQKTPRSYSSAFSMWGFSYSVHHHMNEIGIRAGGKFAEEVISKFMTQNLRSGGSLFIVHPDILSDEQRILKHLRQPTISRTKDKQSSSKRVLDSTLGRLEKLGLVFANCTQLKGDPIRYSSMDEALEIFLNFHMHGSLNRSRRLLRSIDLLKSKFAEYQQGDEILISPGCFIYEAATAT